MPGLFATFDRRTRRLRAGSWRAATETVVALIALAAVGAVLGPQWDPSPLGSGLTVSTEDTAITGAPALGSYHVRTTVVTVQLDGTSVQAQISEPIGAPARHPGVVFVHGAGTGKYQVAFVEQAHALASAGVTTIVPDKRLDTYTVQHRNYVGMAADYERSVELLRGWPGVDPDAVGVYAESEGGWIAPVMAVQDTRIAFVVLVSSPVVPPRQQAAFAVDNYLRNTGVPSEVFRAIPRAVGLSLPGAFEYVDFDVSVWQQQMRQPVLVAYGTDDASMPLVQGAQQIISDAAQAGDDDVTVRYYAGANHGLKIDDHVVPDFLRDLCGWVLGMPGTAGAAPQVAGAHPTQEFRAAPVPTPRWLRYPTVMVTVVLAAAGGLLLAVLVVGAQRVVRFVRRRPTPERPDRAFAPGVGARALLCGAGCLVTVVALVWYLVAVARLALDYQRDAIIVTGGWVGVRLLGVATVTAGVLALRRAVAARREGLQVATGVASRAALGLAVLAAAVLLVVLAYWGVFQLGI
ncbi:MAG: alpha/beta hydrolase [Cellulomonas sp.]|nr:alpha/beta hydrolase [Cellulomonas sp.]